MSAERTDLPAEIATREELEELRLYVAAMSDALDRLYRTVRRLDAELSERFPDEVY